MVPFGPCPTVPAGHYSVSGLTLTRTDTGSWLTDGFVYGQVLQIGPSPAWKIAAVTATTLTLSGPAIGDTTGMAVQGFSPSPLVVFGDTSQDGVWYSGDPHTMTQRDFGPKAFPTTIGNGTPDYIFPVADTFRYAGNDVIDASALFAAVPNGQVPSVGVTLYGGAGNDTILGSQANDFIAGGSGNNVIEGERGQNQLFGSDGLNVQIISRTVSFPTVNASVYQDADHLLAGNNLMYGDTPGSIRTDRFGDFNDVIFGAMGIVTQDTVEATVGTVTGTQRTVPGVTITSNAVTGRASLTCGIACFLSSDAGLDVSDGEVETMVREQTAETEEDPDTTIAALRESGAFERLREDLRLRAALDRVASEVKRIPVELAEAREAIWTPDKEKPETETKLWTPASKET